MKRSKNNIRAELADLIGEENLKALTMECGGRYIYIPHIKKHDRRVEYLKNLQYMQDYLDHKIPIDEIVAENSLTYHQCRFLNGLVKFCLNRYITSFKGLISAVLPFSGKTTEKLVLLIGTAPFARLLEQHSGKCLYIPRSEESRRSISSNSADTRIFSDLMSGMTIEETALKNKVSTSKVKNIAKIYGIGEFQKGAENEH